jgi:hypothetical protein
VEAPPGGGGGVNSEWLCSDRGTGSRCLPFARVRIHWIIRGTEDMHATLLGSQWVGLMRVPDTELESCRCIVCAAP